MSYDNWKCRSPDDEYPEECYHEEYESNWEGRATCDRCGKSWWMTAAQIEAERNGNAAYDAYVRQEMRRERIERWVNWLAFWRRWRKPKARAADIDDEIPF